MKHTLLLVVALLLVLASVRAEDKPTTYEVVTEKDIAYNDSADAERHKLDLYLPKDAKGFPVLFYIHGGGWTRGSKASFSDHGKTFASQGIGCVSVNYRLSPKVKHPAHIEDVAQAFAWAMNN